MAAQLDPTTILVVDDVTANLQVIVSILEAEHRVITATDGETALELALAEEPDIILIDIRMPGMNGYELCGRLKQGPATRNIPVIFVTGMDEEREEARGLELGAIDYITKPLSRPILLARVRNHIELKRQRDHLQRLSAVDGLTGISNRRAFADYLDKEWRGAIRQHAPISLLMADIDNFKEFNDAYGHMAGDECLRKVAAALAGAVMRPADMVARFGGEEFAVILPDTGANEATLVGERLLTSIRRMGLPHQHSGAASYVTLSFGLVAARPERGMESAELIEMADRLLYQAKSEGRNRIKTGMLLPLQAKAI
jgi:diguanylate cyclase (GGDEF)-like protein